jgi:hypothetical protein
VSDSLEIGMLRTWLALTADGAQFALETQQVIGLRVLRIAAGGAAAQAEMARMMTEKAFASAEAMTTVAMGGSARKVLRRNRTRVKANARRLSRRKS